MSPKQKEGLEVKGGMGSYLKQLIFVTGLICTIVSTGYTLILLPKMRSEIRGEVSPVQKDVTLIKLLMLNKSTPEEIRKAVSDMNFLETYKNPGSK